ncbi:hypothetical protein TNCV_2999371 [Trichonephila clavipes]|nr:hypothetical protein TNCV_2999371 [Trichonephila clavipes]
MSQQHDLPNHGMTCYRQRDWNPGKPQRSVADAVGVARTARGLLATDHVILNHGRGVDDTELGTPSPNYHTTPTEDVSALDRFNVHRCPTAGLQWYWARTRDKASHDPMPIPLSRLPQPVRPEQDGLLNMIGSNMIGASAVYGRVQFSLECSNQRVLVWRTGAPEITPHSFVKGHNTEELVWMAWGWNQHRRTYGPAYYSYGTLTGRRYADKILRPQRHPLRWSHWRFLCFSRMIMPDRIDLVCRRTCLKLNNIWRME